MYKDGRKIVSNKQASQKCIFQVPYPFFRVILCYKEINQESEDLGCGKQGIQTGKW